MRQSVQRSPSHPGFGARKVSDRELRFYAYFSQIPQYRNAPITKEATKTDDPITQPVILIIFMGIIVADQSGQFSVYVDKAVEGG